MTTLPDILRLTLISITFGAVMLRAIETRSSWAASGVMTTSQIFVAGTSIAVTLGNHGLALTQLSAASWSFLWIVTTVADTSVRGRLAQLAGLLTLNAGNPIASVFFASCTYLLTASTRDLQRLSPRSLTVIWVLIVSCFPDAETLPTFIRISAAIAAIIGLEGAPIIGFTLFFSLIPASLSEAWLQALYLVSGSIFLARTPFGQVWAWPLLMYILMRSAEIHQLALAAISAQSSFIISLTILSLRHHAIARPSRLYLLPVPPFPMFTAFLFGGASIAIFALKAPAAAPYLIIPTLVFGLLVASSLLPAHSKTETDAKNVSHPSIETILSLVITLTPEILLLGGQNIFSAERFQTHDTPLLVQLLTLSLGQTTIWWAPVATSLLAAWLAIKGFVSHFQSDEDQSTPCNIIELDAKLVTEVVYPRILLRNMVVIRKFVRFITDFFRLFMIKLTENLEYFPRVGLALAIVGLAAIGLWRGSLWR